MVAINMLKMTELDLAQKRVLIREDLNVPIRQGNITNSARIERALPTLRTALEANAAVIVMSHLGRPEEGVFDPAFSLEPVADVLSQALGYPVTFVKNWLEGVELLPGEIALCENVRFNVGEKKNDEHLAKKMAALCDIFVMDAFATAHRAQASTVGVSQFAHQACAGPLLLEEIDALTKALKDPARPLVAIVGGSKVSTKINLLNALMERVDGLIVGGGIANTLLASQQFPIGKSLCEKDWLKKADELLKKVAQSNIELPLPVDAIVAGELSDQAKGTVKPVADVGGEDMILDIGPRTVEQYAALIAKAGTIIWNGPVGVFEIPEFSYGTRSIAEAVAKSQAFSIAGGGDILAALDQFQVADDISYVSTGGGAFLEFVESGSLPAISILEERANDL